MAEEPIKPTPDEEVQVDEAWKQQAEEDRKRAEEEAKKLAAEGGRPQGYPEVNFNTFLSGLTAQALVALGQIENPLAEGQRTLDLGQAKYVIDTLLLVKEKMKGNLDKKEQTSLDGILYDLQMAYVQTSKAYKQAVAEGKIKPVDPNAAPSASPAGEGGEPPQKSRIIIP